jgi:Raf kinase inhibitor-like YbhB/YbcL family protein
MKTSELPAGAGNKDSKRLPPASVECRNDYGESGYGGPCPPPGSPHQYLVEVHALNVEKLPFGSETPPGKMAMQIETHFHRRRQADGKVWAVSFRAKE